MAEVGTKDGKTPEQMPSYLDVVEWGDINLGKELFFEIIQG